MPGAPLGAACVAGERGVVLERSEVRAVEGAEALAGAPVGAACVAGERS